MGWCPNCNFELEHHEDKHVNVAWNITSNGIANTSLTSAAEVEFETCPECFFQEIVDFRVMSRAVRFFHPPFFVN